MKLKHFIEQLIRLQNEGHGDKPVYYRHGASGDCGILSSAVVSSEIDDKTGPFDLPEDAEYIKIYAGN